MTTTRTIAVSRSRSRGRSPRQDCPQKPDSGQQLESDSGKEEPPELKEARRAKPEPLAEPDEDTEECSDCGGRIRGGRIGMKMHKENSMKHRQYVYWQGGTSWQEAGVKARREIRREWQQRREDWGHRAPGRERERREPDPRERERREPAHRRKRGEPDERERREPDPGRKRERREPDTRRERERRERSQPTDRPRRAAEAAHGSAGHNEGKA